MSIFRSDGLKQEPCEMLMTNGSHASECVNNDSAVRSVQKWVETFVVGMNLCPFAKHEMLNNRVRFTSTKANSEEQLLMALQDEVELLNSEPAIETTLLIHPNVLQDFYDYNQFLALADALLVDLKLEGTYQIASFHPDYQFGGTEPGDAENYTNRAPYPVLHLIREASLERAIKEYPESSQIPDNNVAQMNSLGHDKLQALFKELYKQ